jgi:hypothetical protein
MMRRTGGDVIVKNKGKRFQFGDQLKIKYGQITLESKDSTVFHIIMHRNGGR